MARPQHDRSKDRVLHKTAGGLLGGCISTEKPSSIPAGLFYQVKAVHGANKVDMQCFDFMMEEVRLLHWRILVLEDQARVGVCGGECIS